MAVSASAGLLSRLTNARNIVRTIGNHANITPSLDRNLFLVTRKYSVDINAIVDTEEDAAKPKKKLSKAMRAYLERAKEYDKFIKKEITEYEIGKRHLANMMGENPETFTQDDVNKSIKYLFPSGLFVKKARPIMEHPEKVFPPRKAAEFDETGRPYHPFFYTCTPNYYQLLHDIVANIHELNVHEDLSLKKGMRPRPEDQLNALDSDWVSQEDLEKHLLEKITEDYYEKFIAAGERLVEHPYSARIKDFIGKVRKQKILQTKSFTIPECQHTPEGRPFVTVKDCKRKTARATVTVLGKGQGKITINGEDIRYFFNQQSREQVIFPLIFAGLENDVDVEATVKGGGFTGQSGAIRFGISWALRSFVDSDTVEKMRIAGLLTRDVRRKERKKPGQEGARRKFTWKKR